MSMKRKSKTKAKPPSRAGAVKAALPELPTKPNAVGIRKRGRPQKLNDEIQQEIVNAIRVGAYLETAAACAGIHKDTLNDWLRKGAQQKAERKHGRHRDFSVAVAQAAAHAELSAIGRVRNGGAQWNAWWLERTKTERFGRRDRLEHTGADGGPIRAELEGGGLEALFRKLAGETENDEATAQTQGDAPTGVKGDHES